MALDSPLSIGELRGSFPAEFYEEFCSSSAPTFYEMILQIKENNAPPPNKSFVNLSLLMNPGKDPTLPSSFRPISLLNVDLK